MSSLSKRKKRCKGLKVGQHGDRITNLPDSLIAKILSRLTTKNAVATSVLSKKWKRLWTLVTNLNFDDSNLSYGLDPNWDTPAYRKFTNFVTRMLLLRDKSFLQRIHLNCCLEYDDSLVNAWLIAISQCTVQELDISIPIKHPGLLPSDIFLCHTLVVLKLDVRGCVHMPFSACLPGLKTLHINGVQISDDVSIKGLLSGCPLLEDLSLSHCVGKDVRVININAPVLKSLTVVCLPHDEPENLTSVKYQIVIDTPALEHLEYSDYIAKISVVNSMDHLIKAQIDFDNSADHLYNDHFRQIYSEAIHDFLTGISQVRNLVLSCSSMVVIGFCQVVLPKFSNLTDLNLNTEGDLLPEFLDNSPFLETLCIQQGDEFTDKGTFDTLALHSVPSCFLFHLKEIIIESFNGREDEMKVVKYILKNAQVLKTLTLSLTEGVEDDADCLKALLSLPRASTICKVVYG